jgi:hypothetical protein
MKLRPRGSGKKTQARIERSSPIKNTIRAADFFPKPTEGGTPSGSFRGTIESFQLSQSNNMLLNLFGEIPDYSDPNFENLWQDVFNAEENNIIAYCLEKGVDVLDGDGESVPGWRDIAVMLKAVDTNILKMENPMTENPMEDGIRQTFIEIYKELSEVECDRITAMVNTAMRVRKEMDIELAAKLEVPENLIDYREYLFAEFRIFGIIPESAAAQVFAEYLLYSIMDKLEAEKVIDFNFLLENMKEIYTNASSDDKAYIDEFRRIFPWGRLVA